MSLGQRIIWRCCKTDPPDDEQTVLLYVPNAKAEPVWPGYKEGDLWQWDNGTVCKPKLWAEMPYPEEAE